MLTHFNKKLKYTHKNWEFSVNNVNMEFYSGIIIFCHVFTEFLLYSFRSIWQLMTKPIWSHVKLPSWHYFASMSLFLFMWFSFSSILDFTLKCSSEFCRLITHQCKNYIWNLIFFINDFNFLKEYTWPM